MIVLLTIHLIAVALSAWAAFHLIRENRRLSHELLRTDEVNERLRADLEAMR